MSNYEIGTVRTTVGRKTTVHGYVPVLRRANGTRKWLTGGYFKTREEAERALYELRVRELEAEGMTRSDAQAVADAESM